MSGVQLVEVHADDADTRLDRWFKRHYPDCAFSIVQKAMRKGDVRLDKKRVKGNERIEAGQTVRVPPQISAASHAGVSGKPAKHKPTLNKDQIKEVRDWVIYKDDSVIAVNKPPGLPTQGGTGQTRHLDGLLDALQFEGKYRPKLVHRLDKDTSGALLLGRTPKAAAVLARAFQSKETDKRYWAVVTGAPEVPDGRIDLKMDKFAVKGHERMIVTEQGKHSRTDFSVVDSLADKASWLALKPHTGRTHQLRLHCAEMGNPIVGDGKYGAQDAFLTGNISRKLHLHSRFIRFPHPDGGMAEVIAELPDHMAASFDFLGFDVRGYEDPDFE